MKHIYYGDLLLKIIFLFGAVIPITMNARDYLNHRIEVVRENSSLTSANIYEGYFVSIFDQFILYFIFHCKSVM